MVKTMSKTSIQYSNPPPPPPPCYSAVQPGYQCHSQEPMHKVSFPPSLTQPQGLVSIDAEWEENSFFSTKRMRHHETWSVSTDPNTHAIIADYTAKYDSNPHQEASSEIDTKLLPHYYTIHSVNLDEGRSRQPIINFFAWTERNIQCGPILVETREIDCSKKNTNYHIALSIIRMIIECSMGPEFIRTAFPWQEGQKNPDDSQQSGGYWVEGNTENWWDAPKKVSSMRQRLKGAKEGRVVWRVRSETEMVVPFQWKTTWQRMLGERR